MNDHPRTGLSGLPSVPWRPGDERRGAAKPLSAPPPTLTLRHLVGWLLGVTLALGLAAPIGAHNPTPFLTRPDVIALYDSLEAADPGGPPPVEPPPVEPPPPIEPPPPPSGVCPPGAVALGGFWAGFCADELRNFSTEAEVGIMRSNAIAGKRLGAGEEWSNGWVEFEVLFATERLPFGGGGKHLFSIASSTQIVDVGGCPGPACGWFRPDLTVKDGRWWVYTYNTDAQGRQWFRWPGGTLDWVVDVWDTGKPAPNPGQWSRVRIEWRRTGAETMEIKFLGAAKTVRIHPESRNPRVVFVGNMDELWNFGGRPEIRFRALRWGR